MKLKLISPLHVKVKHNSELKRNQNIRHTLKAIFKKNNKKKKQDTSAD